MKLLKMIKFDFINIFRNPSLVVTNIILPYFLIGVMGFVTRSKFGASSVSSYDYYGINMMLFVLALMPMTASNTFMEEKVIKGNSRVVYAPISKREIYMSKLLATYLFGTISYTLLLLIGQYILHLNYGGKNIIYILVLCNLLMLLGSCFGTMFCCIAKSEEKANTLMQIPVALTIFLGDIFFAVHRLGNILEKLSNLSPVKWVNVCSFKIIYDNDLSIFIPVAIALLIVSIICIIVCQVVFKPEECVC